MTTRNKHDNSAVAHAIGRAIKAQRERTGITGINVARNAGIDRSYLYQLEKGIRQPTVAVFIALAKSLDLTPELLLNTVISDLGMNLSTEIDPQLSALGEKGVATR